MSKNQSMTKSEVIVTFNEILSNFLQQISPLIGTSYNLYFNVLIKMNAVSPIKHFVGYVLDPNSSLEKQILNKDEDYFKNVNNYKGKLQNQDDKLMEIIRLQDIYEKLSKDSKENVWGILQSLLFLAKNYVELSS
jgi:hypothetical protein